MNDQPPTPPERQGPDDAYDDAQSPADEDELTCELGKWAAQVREHLAKLQELGSPAPRPRSYRRPRRTRPRPPQQ